MGDVSDSLAKEERDSESTGSSGSREEWKYDMSPDEEDLILRLHKLLGDRWGLIAGRLPWRTAQEIEKYWKMRNHTH